MKYSFCSQRLLKTSTAFLFLLAVLLSLGFLRTESAAAVGTTYSIQVWLENADDDNYTLMDRKIVVRDAAAGEEIPEKTVRNEAIKAVIRKLTGSGSAELSETGFHLRGEGAPITGYAPGEDYNTAAKEHSEAGLSAYEYGYFDVNGNVQPADDKKIREDGKSLVKVYFNRDRYAVYLRHENKNVCSNSDCSMNEWDNAWDKSADLYINDEKITISLPADPFIVKNGASFYERFHEDQYVGKQIVQKLEKTYNPHYGFWARWARVPNRESHDDMYRIELYNTPATVDWEGNKIIPPHNAFDVMNGAAYGLKDGADTFTINGQNEPKNLHIVLRIESVSDKNSYGYWSSYNKTIKYSYYENSDTEYPFSESYMSYHNRQEIYKYLLEKDIWLNKPINGYVIKENQTPDGSNNPHGFTENTSIKSYTDSDYELKRYSYLYDRYADPGITLNRANNTVFYYAGPGEFNEQKPTYQQAVYFGDGISDTQPKNDKGELQYIENKKQDTYNKQIYVFKGWYEDPDFIQKADLTENRTMPDHDLKFYGKWETETAEFSFTKIWDGYPGNAFTPADPDEMMKGLTLIAETNKNKAQIEGEKITFDRVESAEADGKMVWTYTVSNTSQVEYQYADYIKNTVITVSENTSGGSQWTVKFTNLPKYFNDLPVTYSVTEKMDGYYTYVNGDYLRKTASDGDKITNFLNKLTISGTKSWDHISADDVENLEADRPESIIIHLHRKGTKDADRNYREAIASKENGWKYEFTDVPAFSDEGKKIDYELHEVSVENYHVTLPVNGIHMVDPEKDEESYEFHNKYTPGYKDLTVKKEWDDTNDQDGLRPSSINVTLLADGQPYIPASDSENKNPAELTADNGWAYEFESVPIYNENNERIIYSVQEDIAGLPEGYNIEEIQTPSDGNFIIVNKYTPQTVELSIDKTWNEPDEDHAAAYRPEPKEFLEDLELYATVKNESNEDVRYVFRIENISDGEVSGDTYTFSATSRSESIAFTITINAGGDKNAWKILINGLPKYIRGKEITWSIDEFVDYYNDKIEAEGTSFKATNTLALTDVKIHKTWVDNNSSKRPDPENLLMSTWLTANNQLMYRPGTLTGGEQEDGTYFYRSDTYPTVTAEVVITDRDNWDITVAGLPKTLDGVEMNWVIHERLDHYTPVVTGSMEAGFTITNTLIREVTEVSGVKKWNDNGYSGVVHPESVTILLFSIEEDGTETEIDRQTVTAGEDGSWSWRFSDLDKYDENGNLIEYKINEVSMEGYNHTAEKDAQGNRWVITNIYTPGETEISVRKDWDDEAEDENERPESVTVNLLADGEVWETAALDADHNWEHEFQRLPIYSETDATHRIVYTVREDELSGYTANVSGNPAEGYVITNKAVTTPEEPEEKEKRQFFLLDRELPQTGITGSTVSGNPASVRYSPLGMELQIPSLNITSRIVTVEPDAGGVYPVSMLGMDAGLLAETALPGEGISVIAAHNTLNAEEYGPFAMISVLNEGDRFFIRQADDSMLLFEVYANIKIGSADVNELYETAGRFDSTVTLLTCEDERPEGGYASRRIVSAREITR